MFNFVKLNEQLVEEACGESILLSPFGQKTFAVFQ